MEESTQSLEIGQGIEMLAIQLEQSKMSWNFHGDKEWRYLSILKLEPTPYLKCSK